MTSRTLFPPALLASLAVVAASCGSSNVQEFTKPLPGSPAPIALANIRVIDGSGQPARDAQTIVLQDQRIVSVGPAATTATPAGAHVIDLSGHTVFPGLVGVHNHLFYHLGDGSAVHADSSFAKLYLAAGVTTIRTAGTFDFEIDRRLKERIDAGRDAGPTIHLTGPYLYGTGSASDPPRIAAEVNRWADRGATSFKAYTSLRRDELKAAVDAAHARGLKVTGHLCAVGFQEAAALGIDNLEHGLLVDTEFFHGKQPDVCPDASPVLGQLVHADVSSPMIQRTISALVRRRRGAPNRPKATPGGARCFAARWNSNGRSSPPGDDWRPETIRRAGAESWRDSAISVSSNCWSMLDSRRKRRSGLPP